MKLIDPKKSHAVADVMHTGGLDEIGWIKPAEGLLAYDRNADGLVDIAGETEFRSDLPNTKTSLRGLAALASTGSNPAPVASDAALQPSDTLNSAGSNGGAMSMAVESSRSGEDGPTGDVVESATVGSLDASGWWQQAGPVTSEAKAQNMVPRLDPGAHTTADTPSIASPVADAATLQRQQLLRQAMAAFQGGGSGGSAAIWNRQGIAHSDAFVAGLPAAAVPRVQAATLAA